MLVSGKRIADDLCAELRQAVAALPRPLRLAVFTAAPNFETQKFLALKQRRAEEIGVSMEVIELPETSSTDAVIAAIAAHSDYDGMLIQLPFPPHIDIEPVISALPSGKDVDVLRYGGEDTEVLPPVIGAIAEIAARHHVTWSGKQVVVVGGGRLVGRPAALYAKAKGADVTVVTKEQGDLAAAVRQADILVLGAGSPRLITPQMVREGVIVFDAGTSEESGVLMGDADPAVATVAGLITPVPGGIGPITVAVLFKNLLHLTTRQ